MGWATETLLRLERRRLRPKGSVSSAYLSWLWGGTDAKSASEATVRRTPAFQLSTDGPTSAKAHTTGMQFTTGGSATASEASGVDTGQWCRRGSGVGCVSPLRSDDSGNATVNATALHMAARLSGSIGVKSPVAHGGRMPQREVVRQSARGGGRSGKGTVTSLSAAVTQTMRLVVELVPYVTLICTRWPGTLRFVTWNLG